MGRLGTPADIGDAVNLLCSEEMDAALPLANRTS
jgi:hypothetical protein